MKAIPTAICFCFFGAVINPTSGQPSSQKYALGIMAGGMVYQGDLANGVQGSMRTTRPAFSLWASRRFTPSWTARLALTAGSLRADEALFESPAFRKERALAFQTPVVELSPHIVFTPFGGLMERSRISTYLTAGVSLAWVNVQRDFSRFNAAYFSETENLPARIAEDMAQSPPSFVPAIPLGVGMRYGLNNRFNIHAEFTYRQTFTDYLDGFRVAGNPALRDHYYSVMVGLSYNLGQRNPLDCPPVKD
jgi:hypothetical protein